MNTVSVPPFGFILLRHVNSETTNKYWNRCVHLIRTHYKNSVPIVIIDDNSRHEYVKPDKEYPNITVVQSEYPQRGELLPYIYYARHKWFETATIIHDSVFLHAPVPFMTIKLPAISLWHAPYDKENLHNIMRIVRQLRPNQHFVSAFTDTHVIQPLQKQNTNKYLSFGAMCFIRHSFLLHIEQKYKLSNLVNVIRCRKDRCAFERIIGIIINVECPMSVKVRSIFGSIFNHPKRFEYTFQQYMSDVHHKRPMRKATKVWTGR